MSEFNCYAFSIEEQGKNNLVAVFYPATDDTRTPFSGKAGQTAFNEQGLTDRIATLEERGCDASLSKAALASLQERKAQLG